MKNVLILLFFALLNNNVIESANVTMFEEFVICNIHPSGRHKPHKMPSRNNNILLNVCDNSIGIVAGIGYQQLIKLELYSNDGSLLYEKQSSEVNGNVIMIDSNVIEKASKVSVSLNGKEYIGIL